MYRIKGKGLVLIMASLLIFTGCGRKWKKTSETLFTLEVLPMTPYIDYLSITGGTLKLEKFVFDGTRKQGSAVYFEDNFPDNQAIIDMATGTTTPPLYYDLPQGTYDNMRIGLHFDKEDSNNSLRLNGVYTNKEAGTKHNFILQIEDKLVSEITAQNLNGDNSIVIIAEEMTNAKIQLDVKEWFALVPSSMLTNAFSGSKASIVISKTQNSDIYALIAGRIGIGDRVVFE